MSKFCIYCGETLIKEAKFCAECGKEQPPRSKEVIPTTVSSTENDNEDLSEEGNPTETWRYFAPVSDEEGSRTGSVYIQGKESGIGWKGAVLVFGLISIVLFVAANISNQSREDFAAPLPSLENPVKRDESSNSKPPTDCKEIGNGSSFSEIESCKEVNPSGENETNNNVESSNASNQSTIGVEDRIRSGLRANCDALPTNFESLRFQSRGETFNNYGMPLELFSFGSATLTLLQDGISGRVGYADESTYAILNSWQCIFPFDIQ